MAVLSHCDSSSPPLKRRLRPSVCYFCCFTVREDGGYNENHSRTPIIRRICCWILPLARKLPEIRDQCLRLGGRSKRKVGHSPAEFSYDPLSYTLNFEDNWSREEDEEFPLRNFLARIPATPDRTTQAKCAL